ncbi:MAG: zinc ribbon domain-containing protein [Oscillospiraceae bacterium]|nr:zinc ribbon domain-containing protein [Oscillospiraceae bacterium]
MKQKLDERYLFRAKRTDNGKIVTGHCFKMYISNKGWVYGIQVRENPNYMTNYEVDPDTVEPVSVKVESSGQVNKKKCPNCGIIVNPGENYCYDCGQRLSWSEVKGGESDE